MGGSSKKPKKSAAEKELERSQLEQLSDLQDEENRKKKAILRNRLGLSQLLTGSAAGILDGGGSGRRGRSGGRGRSGSGSGGGQSPNPRTNPTPPGGGIIP